MRRMLLAALVLVVGCSGPLGETTPTSTTLSVAAATEIVSVAVRAAASRLPLVDIVTSASADDPNGLLGQPGQYVARVAWRDERLRPTATRGEAIGVETGGSMERFASAKDLADRKESLEATLGLLVSSEVLFVHGLVLLRLPGTLTPAQAEEVDEALVQGLGPAATTTTASTTPTTARSTRSTRPRRVP